MSDALQARQNDLDKILADAEKLQEKYVGKAWDAEDRKRFDTLCAEGAALQQDIESEAKFARLQQRDRVLREIPEATMPSGTSPLKSQGPNEVAGYITLGDMVLASPVFRDFAAKGYPRGPAAVINLGHAAVHGRNIHKGIHGEPLVPLTRETRKMVEEFLQTKEAKAIPTLATGVINPDRVARIPQVTADQRLSVRDVLNSGTTTSNAIEYVREEAITGEAAPTAHGAVKPELSIEYTLQSAPVRTIAGWMPVQNQQLDDWSQLRGLIDSRLQYKVRLAEERQIFFGDGAGVNLEGILNVTGIQNIAANGRYNGATHTLIDAIRMGITDIFVAGYNANVVFIDPRDWETILLEKGTDDRYVWAVVTDNNGSRIWGVRVVETVGLVSTEVGEVGRREILVADTNAGVQLVDRMDLTVQVGLVDDQLIRNMRTILAEERIALPIYAPAAFAHLATEAGS